MRQLSTWQRLCTLVALVLTLAATPTARAQLVSASPPPLAQAEISAPETSTILTVAAQPVPSPPPAPVPPDAPQAPRPPQGPRSPEAPRPPAPPPGQAVNVRVEVTITDQPQTGEAATKTLTMMVADREMGQIRSSEAIVSPASAELAVDARPWILDSNKIRLVMIFEFTTGVPASTAAADQAGQAGARATRLREGITSVLENGKPLVVSQSADPLSGRKVTVEVRATILR